MLSALCKNTTKKQNKTNKENSHPHTHTHKSLLAIAILCCHIMCLLVVLFTPVTVSSLIPENPFWPLALQEVCEFSASSQTCAESKHKVRNSWASICTSQIMNSSTRIKLLLWNPEASEEHSEEMFGTAEYGSVLAQRALKTHEFFGIMCTIQPKHMDHWPDLPPSKFICFSKMQIKLKDCHFDRVEDVQRTSQKHKYKGTWWDFYWKI